MCIRCVRRYFHHLKLFLLIPNVFLPTTTIGSASCVAKFALDPTSPIPNWVQQQCLNVHTSLGGEGSIDYTCLLVSFIPRGLFFLTMLGLNLVMVASFMQGMSESGTVIATALSTGTNFSVSVCIINSATYLVHTSNNHFED